MAPTSRKIDLLIYIGLLVIFGSLAGGLVSYMVAKDLTIDIQEKTIQRLGVVTTTGTFPAALNNFQDNDIINSGDWNNIEYAIGETGTTSPKTLTYQVVNTNANNVNFTGKLTITSATTTNQTITNLWVTTFNPTNSSTTNATLTNFWSTNGQITNASTTNLTISASGQITNANLANSTISSVALGGTLANLTATDGTLTFSGTYTGATARTIGLNLSSINSWTGGQTFLNATSSASLFLPYGTLTLTQGGQVQINSNSNKLQFNSNGVTQVLTATSSFSFTVASTTASENITLKRFSQAVTIQKVSCVNQGGSSPSVTYNLPHGTDRTSGTNLFTSNEAMTNTTTGTQIYTFADATLAAGEAMWLITSANSGSSGFFGCTVFYFDDN